MGIITASFNRFFAFSRPAISSHLTFGFSFKIAEASPPRNFLSSPSSSFDLFCLLQQTPLYLMPSVNVPATRCRNGCFGFLLLFLGVFDLLSSANVLCELPPYTLFQIFILLVYGIVSVATSGYINETERGYISSPSSATLPHSRRAVWLHRVDQHCRL